MIVRGNGPSPSASCRKCVEPLANSVVVQRLEPFALHDTRVELRGVVARCSPREPDAQVRVRLLRIDERVDIGAALCRSRHRLLLRVAALRRVALHFPANFERGLRIEPHRNVEERAQRTGVERKQPVDDDDVARLEGLARAERAVRVVVDGLDDRFAAHETLQIVFHRREIVCARIERRQPGCGALRAIERVVVVEAHFDDALRAEDRVDPPAERRLAAAGIAADGDHDRACHLEDDDTPRTSRPSRRPARTARKRPPKCARAPAANGAPGCAS